MADQPTPASPFDSEFESWLHTALLGGAPMRGTNLPTDIVKALQNLAANENATSDDQQTLRDQWSQHKRDEAQKEQQARDAAAAVEAAATQTPADPQPAPGQDNNDELLEDDTTPVDAPTEPDTTPVG
jgi:hypothetical protein